MKIKIYKYNIEIEYSTKCQNPRLFRIYNLGFFYKQDAVIDNFKTRNLIDCYMLGISLIILKFWINIYKNK